mmetsp:Transcript_20420/g.40418  ORF Transcript_20420/g.40418 Transcript_20420/m.40418 type:complete len:223 (+) Transcript_20420:4329-4997(+)
MKKVNMSAGKLLDFRFFLLQGPNCPLNVSDVGSSPYLFFLLCDVSLYMKHFGNQIQCRKRSRPDAVCSQLEILHSPNPGMRTHHCMVLTILSCSNEPIEREFQALLDLIDKQKFRWEAFWNAFVIGDFPCQSCNKTPTIHQRQRYARTDVCRCAANAVVIGYKTTFFVNADHSKNVIGVRYKAQHVHIWEIVSFGDRNFDTETGVIHVIDRDGHPILRNFSI